jgi:YVTN family beta-propeller protein
MNVGHQNTLWHKYVYNNAVSVINGSTKTAVTNITDVGVSPNDISVNPNTNKVYVLSTSSNSVSVIDGKTNRITKTINLDPALSYVAVNPVTNTTYVTNFQSNIMYVINGMTDNLTAGLTFRVNTPGSGDINCTKKLSNEDYVVYDPYTEMLGRAKSWLRVWFLVWRSAL